MLVFEGSGAKGLRRRLKLLKMFSYCPSRHLLDIGSFLSLIPPLVIPLFFYVYSLSYVYFMWLGAFLMTISEDGLMMDLDQSNSLIDTSNGHQVRPPDPSSSSSLLSTVVFRIKLNKMAWLTQEKKPFESQVVKLKNNTSFLGGVVFKVIIFFYFKYLNAFTNGNCHPSPVPYTPQILESFGSAL